MACGGADLRRQDDDALRDRRAPGRRHRDVPSAEAARRRSACARTWCRSSRATASCASRVGASGPTRCSPRDDAGRPGSRGASLRSAGRPAAQPTQAQHCIPLVLWPEGVPGAKPDGGVERHEDGRVYNVQSPTLTYYPPPPGTVIGTAVIVCPGGGYARLAMANEAAGAVRALQPLGVSDVRAEVPPRRVRPPGAAAGRAPRRADGPIAGAASSASSPIASASSARRRAAISPPAAATLFDATEGQTGAALDAHQRAARLRGAALSRDHHARPVCARRLAPQPAGRGAAPTRSSSGCRSRARCAPTCRRCSSCTPRRTRACRIENSVALVEALRARGRPVEAHFYERGAHGFGMAADLGTTSGWVARWTEWMQAHGWL